MKNGIYLFVILFLGTMCYFVVNDLYKENSITLASLVFLVVSVVIFYLASHLKKRTNIMPVHKIMGVMYISLLLLYGLITALPLLGGLIIESSTYYMEGSVFLIACLVLAYAALFFTKKRISNNTTTSL